MHENWEKGLEDPTPIDFRNQQGSPETRQQYTLLSKETRAGGRGRAPSEGPMVGVRVVVGSGLFRTSDAEQKKPG